MGFRTRTPKIKIAKGVTVNLGKKGASVTTRNKFVTTTTNLQSGKTKTTVKTPIKGVSYIATSSGSQKKDTVQKVQKVYSPKTYKICGILALIFGIIGALLGIVTFPVGGFIILIISIILIMVGVSCIKRSKAQ